MNALIIYAKAGGGHQSVARALEEGFRRYHPDVSVTLLDIMEEYTPFPINKFPAMYPALTRAHGVMWKAIYTSTDGEQQAQWISRAWWPVLKRRITTAFSEQDFDLVVSVYPLLNRVVGKILHQLPHPPHFAVAVTDLGTAHALWVSRHAEHYLAPTALVYSRLLSLGVEPEKVSLVGLPVHPDFRKPAGNKVKVRKALGLCETCPVVLVMGGADGMGQLEKIMEAINARGTWGTFVVVAGRNAALQRRLQAHRWHIDVRVLGFVRTPAWMQAADLLLTKAGPSTISEALACSLPMVITGYLPGQEKANVTFVESIGAGIYEPQPTKIAALVDALMSLGGMSILDDMRAKASLAGFQHSTQLSVDLLYRIGQTFREREALTEQGRVPS